jgi:glycosyltransferase involved in cell wall biosynthesis
MSISNSRTPYEESVAVVVPTHNRLRQLVRAIRSAAVQTHLPHQIVVVDDGSNPAVDREMIQGIVRAESDSIDVIVIRTAENCGATAARNTGMAACQSKWIAFLDSDDWWLPDKLQKQLEYLKESPGALVAYGRHHVYRHSRIVPRRHQLPTGNVLEPLICGWSPASTSLMMVDAQLARSVGFDINLRGLQDWDFCMRLALASLFVAPDDALAVIDDHAGPRLSQDTSARLESLNVLEQKWKSTATDFGTGTEFKEAIKRWKLEARIRNIERQTPLTSIATRRSLVSAAWKLGARPAIKARWLFSLAMTGTSLHAPLIAAYDRVRHRQVGT